MAIFRVYDGSCGLTDRVGKSRRKQKFDFLLARWSDCKPPRTRDRYVLPLLESQLFGEPLKRFFSVFYGDGHGRDFIDACHVVSPRKIRVIKI
jgi:hypothetical protein